MKTYYNEFDPFAANWLAQLQRKYLISPGFIQEKSIADIKAKELQGFTRAHFFAGIGGWDLALHLAGWPQEKGVWTGSCPCQPFSDAGKRGGTADARHLWPTWAKLIKVCRPDVIFGEQVASAAGRGWFDGVRADLEGMGYGSAAVDLCAAGFGAPHIRQRLYWMAYAKGQRLNRSQAAPGPHGRAGFKASGAAGRRLGHPSGASLAPSKPQALRGQGRGKEGRATQQHGGASVDGLGNSEISGRPDGSTQPRSSSSISKAPSKKLGVSHAGDNSPWSKYYLIPCSDGKTRRVGTGLFPLADGVPRRVGKLRGAGNAIVPIQAATFVRVCMEFLGMVR